MIKISSSLLIAKTTSAAFFDIPVGVRNIAMGETGVALGSINSPYWNPAGLSRISVANQNQISMSHSWLYENISCGMLTFGCPINKSSVLGAGITYLHLKDSIEEYDNYDNPLNTTYKPHDMAFVLTYANKINRFNYGANLKYIHSQLDTTSVGNTVGFDFGAIYSNRFCLIGAAVQNLGPKIRYINEDEPLPLNFKIGASKNFLLRFIGNKSNLFVEMDINKHKYENPYFNLGMEYPYKLKAIVFFLRSGYKINTENYNWTDGLRGGFGFSFKDYSLDYAFVPYSDLGDTHRISVIVKFGGNGEREVRQKKIKKKEVRKKETKKRKVRKEETKEKEEKQKEEVKVEPEKKSEFEKIYQEGVECLKEKKYLEALIKFNTIISTDPSYKDVLIKMKEANKGLREEIR
ncbi:MAG: PorV/PorQ family protein [Elusimicrobiota bacterium]